jgi:sensor c-di-GMP phosphodiesterase-like protein
VRSRLSNAIVVVAAVLAFAPVAAVDYLLDHYVRTRETQLTQRSVDNLAAKIEASASEAVVALRTVLADSPSLCTPTFIANVHEAMRDSLHVKDVLVENAAGVQYCDGFGETLHYSTLSAPLTIPGHSETLSVVRFDDVSMPMLRLTQTVGAERQVSAFVPVLANAADTLLPGLRSATMVRVSLTNGTPIVTLGYAAPFDQRKADTDFISAQSFAGEIPLRAEAAVPFGTVRADYANLDVSFTVVAGIMCAAFLALMLQYVRRSNLPAFGLERAIAHGELKPYYQPVIDLRTGRLIGCEMLCRWEKRNGTIVSPGAFIDYAEATGLAIPMTVSLMQQVRLDLNDLCREMPEMKVSINLFEGHFRDNSIIDDVQAIFGNSSIGFDQLVFEITERRPLGNSTQAHAVIAGLHALGARLAMDDAGTGHSNLAYLQTLGVDVIKIDRVFVDMIKPETTQVPVLDGLIAVARDLGTDVIAEGVETEAQARYLRQRGVHMAQGYLFAPALKVKSFNELARALNAPDQPTDETLKTAA